MKSMIGYIVVIVALGILSYVDEQSSDVRSDAESAYYSSASLGGSFHAGSLHGKTKEQKREIAMSNNKLAVWPERVLKVKHRNFLLAQAYAVKAGDFNKNMGKVLMRTDDYVVFAPADDAKFDGFIVADKKLPVVVGETDGELGVVTGNVIVKVASPEIAGLVASLIKSEIISVNDTTKTATLKLPLGQDLTEVIHAIRNHSGVESADFQISTKGS